MSFMELGLAFISLQLTFGGAMNPNILSIILESITDLANTILQIDKWDPKDFHSPIRTSPSHQTKFEKGEEICNSFTDGN